MSKWKEGGGMQQSGQTADGTNNTTHSRLWLLIGPWWAFKQALLLTWQNAQHSSIIPTGRQKSCWTTASTHKRWILFWWHLAAFAATPLHHYNSTCPTQWEEFSSWSHYYGLQLSSSCSARGLREKNWSFHVWDYSQLMDKFVAYEHPYTAN